jgi:hypothetical protein
MFAQGSFRITGASLSEELRRRPKAHRRRSVAIGSAALGAATAAVAIVALIGTGGSGGPSSANAAVLAHVARAMSPPANLIVHVKEAGVQPIGTPVSVEWWAVYLDNPQGDRTVVRTHVLAYEELPLTSENERLVSLTDQHPDARVETIAAPTK